MPRKLSSPSQHGSTLERLYARKISPVNKSDFELVTPSKIPFGMGQVQQFTKGAVSRYRQRSTALLHELDGASDARTSRTITARTRLWSAQESLRLSGYSESQLRTLSENYASAAQYHAERGALTKSNEFHALSQAAKKEATTMKRVETARKNKADLEARTRAFMERRAEKLAAKAAKKAEKLANSSTPKSTKKTAKKSTKK